MHTLHMLSDLHADPRPAVGAVGGDSIHIGFARLEAGHNTFRAHVQNIPVGGREGQRLVAGVLRFHMPGDLHGFPGIDHGRLVKRDALDRLLHMDRCSGLHVFIGFARADDFAGAKGHAGDPALGVHCRDRRIRGRPDDIFVVGVLGQDGRTDHGVSSGIHGDLGLVQTDLTSRLGDLNADVGTDIAAIRRGGNDADIAALDAGHASVLIHCCDALVTAGPGDLAQRCVLGLECSRHIQGIADCDALGSGSQGDPADLLDDQHPILQFHGFICLADDRQNRLAGSQTGQTVSLHPHDVRIVHFHGDFLVADRLRKNPGIDLQVLLHRQDEHGQPVSGGSFCPSEELDIRILRLMQRKSGLIDHFQRDRLFCERAAAHAEQTQRKQEKQNSFHSGNLLSDCFDT